MDRCVVLLLTLARVEMIASPNKQAVACRLATEQLPVLAWHVPTSLVPFWLTAGLALSTKGTEIVRSWSTDCQQLDQADHLISDQMQTCPLSQTA